MTRERDQNAAANPRTPRVRDRVGGRDTAEAEDDAPQGLSFQLPLFPRCKLCWARFEDGAYVAGCECVEEQVGGS